jgi:regulator of nucleoside diphosphate kinase
MRRDRVEARPPIAIDADHLSRLSALSSQSGAAIANVCEYLREELDRALIFPAERLPADIVSFGSRVKFRDAQSGNSQEIVLVYPLDADITRGRVSIMTPVGAALLGLSVGQTIVFRTRAGERRELTVLEVARASDTVEEHSREAAAFVPTSVGA